MVLCPQVAQTLPPLKKRKENVTFKKVVKRGIKKLWRSRNVRVREEREEVEEEVHVSRDRHREKLQMVGREASECLDKWEEGTRGGKA